MSIFRLKNTSIHQAKLKRHLKVSDLVFLGLGSMVGTGIFTVTGIGAAQYAGPALMISILISALAVGIFALFYAEFASRIPANGGAYSYIYATLGEFPAWIAGWLTILEFVTAISSVASGWGGYLKGLLETYGFVLPNVINGPFDLSKGQIVDILPVLVMVLVTALVLLDSRKALRFNSTLVVLKFSALALFVILGLFFLKPQNWSDFAPFGLGSPVGGQSGILAGASLMFFAFLGFESISMTVDEVTEPQKNIPKGIAISLLIVTGIYILVTFVLTGVIHYTKLNVSDAVAFALRSIGLNWAAGYVSVVAILTLITVCISMTFALARTVYSISRDGLMPQFLSHVNPKTGVPKNATIVVGVLAMFFSGIIPLSSLAEFVNITTLGYLILMSIGILMLRKQRGNPKNGQFKVPFVPFLPILAILICLMFMTQYKTITWIVFIGALIIGTLIYSFYGYRHSTIDSK
ncbi:amino acid permease [Streptococcus caprae]|uniref:Amino acid permease n=1 Tax=Streptococcus caprae TaxID=1640501 RepID=A0ABV8CVB0_9STRE